MKGESIPGGDWEAQVRGLRWKPSQSGGSDAVVLSPKGKVVLGIMPHPNGHTFLSFYFSSAKDDYMTTFQEKDLGINPAGDRIQSEVLAICRQHLA